MKKKLLPAARGFGFASIVVGGVDGIYRIVDGSRGAAADSIWRNLYVILACVTLFLFLAATGRERR